MMVSTGRVEFEGSSMSPTYESESSFVNSPSDYSSFDPESNSSFVTNFSTEYSALLRDFFKTACSATLPGPSLRNENLTELKNQTNCFKRDKNLLTVFSSPIQNENEGMEEEFEEAPADQLSPSVLAIIEREKTLKRLLASGTLTITLKRPKDISPQRPYKSTKIVKGINEKKYEKMEKIENRNREPMFNLDTLGPECIFSRKLILIAMRAKIGDGGQLIESNPYLNFDGESKPIPINERSSIQGKLKNIVESVPKNGLKSLEKQRPKELKKSQNGFKKVENGSSSLKIWNKVLKTKGRVGRLPGPGKKKKMEVGTLKNKSLIYPQIDIKEFYESTPAQSIQTELNGIRDNFEEAFANRIRNEMSSGWNSPFEEPTSTKQDWSLKNFLSPFSPPTLSKVNKKISTLINDDSSPVTISKVKLKKEREFDPSKFLEIHMDESARVKEEEENIRRRNFSYASNDKAFLWETDLRATLLSTIKH